MSDSALMDMNLRDLDLNQEPMNPHLRRPVPTFETLLGGPTFETLLNELDTAQELIEQRIQQLEGVSARERQRQERNSIETNHFSSETSVDMDSNGGNMNESHLVEKALEINSSVEKAADKGSGSFYDCNICLDMARDPVLTCCGHLFCWPCFYQVSNVYSSSKECPVCKGEVSESTVIPIYGNGGCDRVCETESGLKIPPRPKARRVESVRQLCVTRNLSNVPVDEAIQRIRVSISAMGHYHEQQEENGDGIHRVSRVLSESAASLSSLSSALNSAERLIEDLENVISARNDMRASSVGGNLTGLQSNDQPLGLALTSDSNVVLPFDSSIQSTGVSGSDVHTLRRRASYSLRRRSVISRASDVEGQRQSRRRRLN